jgi:hypothetical protein
VGREGDCAGNPVVISRFRLFRAQAGFGGQSRVYEIRQAKKKGQSFGKLPSSLAALGKPHVNNQQTNKKDTNETSDGWAMAVTLCHCIFN